MHTQIIYIFKPYHKYNNDTHIEGQKAFKYTILHKFFSHAEKYMQHILRWHTHMIYKIRPINLPVVHIG